MTLVDPNESFISCPISNLVIGGSKTMADITVSFAGLDKYGVKRVRDSVTAIDADKKQVRLASGGTLPYDRLVVSPGIEFMYERLQGWSAGAEGTVLHAWKAGPQTVALRRQLTDMKDGGVVVMSIPLAPYRCPPGPYERACQIAWYLKQAKPKSKLIVLDGNPDMVSKKPLFTRVYGEDYKGIVEYRPGAPVTEIDLKGSTVVTELGDKVRGDVVNYIPHQRAANIARDAGLITANNRWCEVNWTTLESVKVKDVHVLGDATLPAPAMPKSGHMANQHGKAAAAAIVELMSGRAGGASDDGEHLLQLRRRQERRARRQRPPMGPGEEDDGDRRGLRRHLHAGPRVVGARRRVRAGMGEDDLVGHADLIGPGGLARPRSATRPAVHVVQTAALRRRRFHLRRAWSAISETSSASRPA